MAAFAVDDGVDDRPRLAECELYLVAAVPAFRAPNAPPSRRPIAIGSALPSSTSVDPPSAPGPHQAEIGRLKDR
ncbi:hypothetical protein EIP91_010961, partial [Steccherinum ochraceum]